MGVARLLEKFVDNGTILLHSSVRYNCVKKPSMSFHQLMLKNKMLPKVWIHKIGQNNLPVNDNTRVCSKHFVNS